MNHILIRQEINQYYKKSFYLFIYFTIKRFDKIFSEMIQSEILYLKMNHELKRFIIEMIHD